MLATSAAPHLFWITSRAAGSAALILSSLAVCLGLMMGGRFVKRRGLDLRSTHEALSLADAGGDRRFTPWRCSATASSSRARRPHDPVRQRLHDLLDHHRHHRRLGRSWLSAFSYYARTRIGRRPRWRKLHRFTALAWIFGPGPLAGRGHGRRPPPGSWR